MPRIGRLLAVLLALLTLAACGAPGPTSPATAPSTTSTTAPSRHADDVGATAPTAPAPGSPSTPAEPWDPVAASRRWEADLLAVFSGLDDACAVHIVGDVILDAVAATSARVEPMQWRAAVDATRRAWWVSRAANPLPGVEPIVAAHAREELAASDAWRAAGLETPWMPLWDDRDPHALMADRRAIIAARNSACDPPGWVRDTGGVMSRITEGMPFERAALGSLHVCLLGELHGAAVAAVDVVGESSVAGQLRDAAARELDVRGDLDQAGCD